MSGRRNISLSIESPTYRVPELTMIIRVGVTIKVRFSFIRESIAEMTFCIVPVTLSRKFLHTGSEYQRRILPLLISHEFNGASGLRFTDFGLTGACRSSKVLTVVWYYSQSVSV